uniref:Uncharacterized protein n=1 Tax=Rhizophora mucronata TaxID=61149 RepID=A0A2P2J4D3_RHIMU
MFLCHLSMILILFPPPPRAPKKAQFAGKVAPDEKSCFPLPLLDVAFVSEALLCFSKAMP